MKGNNNIAVFCAASNDINPIFRESARSLGAMIGQCGCGLVYGGVNLGLMEVLTEAAAGSGATVTGVLPQKLEAGGHRSRFVEQVVLTSTVGERIDRMLEAADVAVALSGGVGTLNEVFYTLATRTLGYHHKPLFVINTDGCFDALQELMQQLSARQLIRPEQVAYCTMLENLLGLKPCLEDICQ